MGNLHVQFLIAGGGLASSSAAEAIREIDHKGAILVVGLEIFRPYDRPPLSKEYLRGEKRHADLFVKPGEWFAEKRIDLRTGRRVAQLDCTRRAVTLDSGEEITFDKLLIATGGSPKHLTCPGADLPNTFYLRTLQDADRLANAIAKAKREGKGHDRGRGRVSVIGAGVLGVEIAASLTQVGIAVDLVCPQEHVWSKFAGDNTGMVVGKYLEGRGVKVHYGQRVARLEGDGRVQRVVLADNTGIECDFVIAAIGMTPNKEILRGTAISAEKAILVDERCRTNVDGVYAAGDCAAVLDPLFGKHRILDHWDNAKVTGRLAGRNMAGADEKYDVVNYFFSDVFELSLSAWGEAKRVERRIVRGVAKVDGTDFVEIGVDASGRVSQVLAVGHSGEDEVLKGLVKARVDITGREEDVRDPQFDLKQL